ncbi:IclR family transcriptional regulator [Shimia thalassica]|uniref:IclR family transcriptional regulator n=1 Tax=Shimia thalassica TaxID=1715693 RepID=UPI0026E1E4A6|nr:IclR family transcriptional regulator [Shimia thalassica]MDO6481641.1 IclR family transcriptional regulator [Shimia thalassica]MDO6483988.1 IclR family transcriptional regulator [Shimia thalassica]MDO6522690.1 IclR family transcriptional regulator [Shimia thalassica]MDO6798838.1 IclR family transcriptional regulator [Shimia thalassica]MDP2579750.1 IclR family transcriptional regulator [Shimia thalassica]
MGTVSKGLSLLGYFSRYRSEIGLSEMTRLSGMNKATVYRLLTELAEQGFVEQIGTGREYRLGPVFPRLAALREAAVPTREVAQKVLSGLCERTGETAHMSIRQGTTLSVVSFSYSALHGTRVTMEDAEQIAFHSTSSGHAVLAFSPPAFVDEILSGPLEKKTEQTETNPEIIRERLQEAARTCIAESVSGHEMDVHSHACPVFDARQGCYGAVAVAAPVARMTPDLQNTIRTEVLRSSLELTRLLGGFVPDTFKSKASELLGEPA